MAAGSGIMGNGRSSCGGATAAAAFVVAAVMMAPLAAQAWSLWPYGGRASADGATPTLSASTDGGRGEVPRFEAASGASVAQLQAGWRELQDLQTSQDPCLLRAVLELQVRCQVLDSTERVRLAILWLNCQRAASRFAPIACGERDGTDACLQRMDKDDFTQYSMFFLKVTDVCTALANDVFRAQVEATVHDLYRAAHDVHAAANRSTHELRALRETFGTLAAEVAAQQEAAAAAANATGRAVQSAWAAMSDALEDDHNRHRARWEAWRTAEAEAQAEWMDRSVAAVVAVEGQLQRALGGLTSSVERVAARADDVADELALATAGLREMALLQADHTASLEAARSSVGVLGVDVDAVARSVRAVDDYVVRGDLAHALTALQNAVGHLERQSVTVAVRLDVAADAQARLQTLQDDHLAALHAAHAVVGTMDAQLHALVRVTRFLGAVLAHGLAVARRALALAGVLGAALVLARVCGRAAIPVWLVWGWAVMAELSAAAGRTRDDGDARLALAVQWAPTALWLLATIGAVVVPLCWRPASPAIPLATATPDRQLIAALVAYIVVLRLQGTDAAMPDALADLLADPPPAYTAAADAKGAADAAGDADGDWLVAREEDAVRP